MATAKSPVAFACTRRTFPRTLDGVLGEISLTHNRALLVRREKALVHGGRKTRPGTGSLQPEWKRLVATSRLAGMTRRKSRRCKLVHARRFKQQLPISSLLKGQPIRSESNRNLLHSCSNVSWTTMPTSKNLITCYWSTKKVFRKMDGHSSQRI